jgi:Domain of unknown function (DUF1906)
MLAFRGFFFASIVVFSGMALSSADFDSPSAKPASPTTFLGFDRNQYPGDDALPALHKTFSFTSYWLSPPPGEKNNSWLGKRALLQSRGFGFLLLYQGRTSSHFADPKSAQDAGLADAHNAATFARREGFPEDSIIFLDIEEGGRFSDTYHAYLRSFVESLEHERFHPGIYCSGIVVHEGGGATIISADDIRHHLPSADIVFWVFNDACPPSPGCTVSNNPPIPSASGVPYAAVWQFVRSPREKKIARHCNGYSPDGNCYVPSDLAHKWLLDLDAATSANPSAPK